MPDYQKLHHVLLNGMSRAIEALREAQSEAEEIYLSAPEPLTPFAPRPKGKEDCPAAHHAKNN